MRFFHQGIAAGFLPDLSLVDEVHIRRRAAAGSLRRGQVGRAVRQAGAVESSVVCHPLSDLLRLAH